MRVRPSRRDFLKLLSLGVASLTVDPERLLWVPGQKTIFLPPVKNMSYKDILAVEMDRVLPMVAEIFDRDDMFFTFLKSNGQKKVS